MTGHSINPMFRSPVSGKIWPGDGSSEEAEGSEPTTFYLQPGIIALPEESSEQPAAVEQGAQTLGDDSPS